MNTLTRVLKGTYILMLLLGGLLLLVACNATTEEGPTTTDSLGSSSANNESNQTVAETDYRNMKAELTVYADLYPGEWEEIFQEHVESYFPNYTFTYITSSGDAGISPDELVAAGTKVDIMMGRAVDLVGEWQKAGLHTSMDEWNEKHGIAIESFEPQYFDPVTLDDELFALPIWNDGFVTFYNREIFDRFGVDHPTDGMSWAESIALANEITRNDNGKQYIGQWYSPKHFLRSNQKSLSFIDPDTQETVIDDDGWYEWVDTLFSQPMQNAGLQEAAKEQYFGHDDFRNDEQVAMYTYQTVWIRQHQTQVAGLADWDLVAVPTFDGDGVGTQPYGQYIALSSISEEPDAAMQVIKYLTGEEFQSYMSRSGFITPLKSTAVRDLYMADNGLEDKNIDAIFYNELAPSHTVSEFDRVVIDTMHHEVLTDVVRGLGDVNSSLRKGKEMADKAIQDELLRQK